MQSAPPSSGFRPEVIEARIRAYESFGIHRTGWEGDDRTSAWLVEELRALGIEAAVERFPFPRVELRSARIAWPGGKAEGVPFYDGGFTDAGGVEAEFCTDEDADVLGKVVVAASALFGDGAWAGPERYERIEALAGRGALGVVLPAGDPDGALVVANAERIDRPLRIPVLQVAPRDVRGLLAEMIVGVEGTLEVDGARLRSHATNVAATLPATNPDAAPDAADAAVGIMTPKSGWFTCAAERGGGIAVFLALAEALAAMPERRRPVAFVASSGHELHHYGLTDYFHRRPEAAAGAVAWLHLGASIGARFPRPRMAASDEALHALARDALGRAGVGEVEALPPGAPGGGEAREVHARGGRFVSFLGRHRYFHSPNDTVEQAVDAEQVARWAQAALDIVQGMLALDEERAEGGGDA